MATKMETVETDTLIRAWYQYAKDANLPEKGKKRDAHMIAFFSGVQAFAHLRFVELSPRITAPLMFGLREPKLPE